MTTKGGRKNLKRAAIDEKTLTVAQGQSIMQVVSLRGSNFIEVIDGKGEKALALFPAKFQSMWIKQGNFVVVDDSGREEAIESGRKVACGVVQVLFHEQVRVLQKCPEWPETFKSASLDVDGNLEETSYVQGDSELYSSDDDDGLPPLEANTMRRKPVELYSYSESDSDIES